MPSQRSLSLARSYYVIAGLIAGAAGAYTIVSSIGSALTGCTLVFAQADFVTPPNTGPIPDNLPTCQQYVDLLAIGIQLALGAALLATAWYFARQGRTATLLLRGGAVLGIAAGSTPLAFILWLINYYRQTPTIIDFAVAGVPLAAALLAAWVTWRATAHRGTRNRQDVETSATLV
jgi:hypothetical protein